MLSGTTASYASSPATPSSPGLLVSADSGWTQQDIFRDLPQDTSTSAVRQAPLLARSAPGVTPAFVREQAVQYKTCLHLRTCSVNRRVGDIMTLVIAVLYLQGDAGDRAPAEEGEKGARCASTGQ